MNIWENLPKPALILAPMDDVTDTVFRQIIADLAPPDLFMTEFVNADGLQSAGRPRLLKKLQFTNKEQPIIAQIWGKDPKNYQKTTEELVSKGFKGVDINMGCPVKAVVKNDCCVALADNRELASKIIKATQKGAGSANRQIPVSVKTRLGINQIDFSWHEFLLKHELDALIVHGRTAKGMSDVPADWEAIGHIKKLRDKLSPRTKIIGNGDVLTRGQAIKVAKKYKIDGVMIGRGVFQDPFVFAHSLAGESPWLSYTPEQKKKLYKKHIELFAKTYEALFPQSYGGAAGSARRKAKAVRPARTLNKFCKIYINGFDGAKELREKLMSAENANELLKMLD